MNITDLFIEDLLRLRKKAGGKKVRKITENEKMEKVSSLYIVISSTVDNFFEYDAADIEPENQGEIVLFLLFAARQAMEALGYEEKYQAWKAAHPITQGIE